jgi:hypothetical protein
MVGVAIGAAAVGAVGSLAAGAMSAGASSSASAANRKMMEAIWAGSQRELNPYQRLGRQGLSMYRDVLGPWAYQSLYQPFTNEQYQQSPLYTPMVRNLAELQATPGYQFQLQQGQQQIDQGAAAKNGVLNGAQQKATQNWGQQVAATGFQAAWDRAQNAYTKAFDIHNQQQASNRAGIAQGMDIIRGAVDTGYNSTLAPWQLAQGMAPAAMESNTTNAHLAGEAMGGGLAGAGTAINNGMYDAARQTGWSPYGQPNASVYWGSNPNGNVSSNGSIGGRS